MDGSSVVIESDDAGDVVAVFVVSSNVGSIIDGDDDGTCVGSMDGSSLVIGSDVGLLVVG